MSSTALTVLDRSTGELVDVREASTERLAVFDQTVDELIAELNDGRAVVSEELVRRLDRDASWTQRVPDPRAPDAAQFEITAPSPQAGSTTYPEADLEAELKGLIARGTISEDGATQALERTVELKLRIPWSADPDAMIDALKRAEEITVAGVAVKVVKAEAKCKTRLPGVAKLLKVPGTAAALARARRTDPVTNRRARVTVKTKADA
jgi:hypothetical protein